MDPRADDEVIDEASVGPATGTRFGIAHPIAMSHALGELVRDIEMSTR